MSRFPSRRAALAVPVSLAAVAGKGGVGKTTTVLSIAACLAELGLDVLAVDADPQANLTTGLAAEPEADDPTIVDVLVGDASVPEAVRTSSVPGVWVLPSASDLVAVERRFRTSIDRELRLRDALRRDGALARFDAVLFDTPPSFALPTLNVLAAARDILVPLQMSGFALKGLRETLRVMEHARRDLNPALRLLGIVPTFVSMRTTLSRELLAAVEEIPGLHVFPARIPLTVRLQETAVLGQPITRLAPRSAAAAAYRAITLEVLDTIGAGRPDPALARGG